MSFFAASRLTAKSQIAIDEPASFHLLQPQTLEEAARMLEEHGADAVALYHEFSSTETRIFPGNPAWRSND